MSLPNYKELISLTTISEIEKEIFVIQKNLLELRVKKATNQAVKAHLFKHAKRRITQLNFKKGILLKEIK